MTDALKKLTPEEQEAVKKILDEYTSQGQSETLRKLYDEDFSEIPVSIDEFIESDEFAGWFTNNGKNIYPYWREKLRTIFDDRNNFSEIVLGGCLTGDTLIPLLNGNKVTMKQLADIGDLDEYVYSYDVKTEKYTVGHLTQAFCTGVKKVYRIYLDNGKYIDATSTHKFLTRDKHWKSIDNGLSVGDSMMPWNTGDFYYNVSEPYEEIYHPKKDGTFEKELTHRMVMRYKLGSFKGVVHHKDRNKKNNDPRNLVRATLKKHFEYHVKTHKQYMATEKAKEISRRNIAKHNEDYKNGNVSEDVLNRIHEGQLKGCASRWSDPAQHTHIAEITRNRMLNGFAKEMASKRNENPKILEHYAELITDKNKDEEFKNRQWICKAVKIANIALVKYGEITETTYQQVKQDFNMRTGYPSYKSALKRISEEELKELARNYNHKITNIEYLGEQPVYDLTVDEHHNFATDCGIVAHNSIGCGKSTIAVIGLAYTLYWLMCLRDPNPYFGLGRGDTIFLVFFNATLQLSRGVAYNKFQSILQHSPWFMARGTISGTKHLEYTPNKTENADIQFTVGSQPEHALGKAIIGGALDEVNFVKGANVEMEKSKIMETYSAVLARIKSRFVVDGKVRGRLFLVSSKKSEYDFIESYIKKVKGNEGVFIADARLYELKASAFSGRKFRVAVGGSNLPSKVIPDNEENETYITQGYYIEEIPIELKQDFELDMIRALRDHCGIAVSETTRYIAYPSLEKCLIPQTNPFKSNVLTIGMLDQLKYQDFFEPEKVPQEIYSKPLFIHFDCSLTGDKTGIGCVAVLGYTNREGFDYITGEHTELRELVYREVFDIGIQCPNGSEISFRKNREFVYYLKYELGWNIKGISLDGFQSADSKQQFITAGFQDTTIVSLDRKPDGHQCFKSAVVERRIQYLSGQDELTTELVNLKQDNMTGKIDHDADHEKDMSDGIVGAVYNASLHDGQFAFHLVDDAMLFGDVNVVSEDSSTDFVNGLISNPANALANRIPKNTKNANAPIDNDTKYLADGFIII